MGCRKVAESYGPEDADGLGDLRMGFVGFLGVIECDSFAA